MRRATRYFARHGKHDVRRVPMRVRYLLDKESLRTEELQIRTARKIAFSRLLSQKAFEIPFPRRGTLQPYQFIHVGIRLPETFLAKLIRVCSTGGSRERNTHQVEAEQ